VRCGVEQRASDVSIIYRLEQPEESGTIAVRFEMEIVVNRGDAADYVSVPPRQKELDRRMLVEWMLRGIDQLVDVATERRDPVGIVPVKPEWKLDELFLIPRRADWLDADVRLSVCQIRSISRPTRRNASSTKSSCDSVCVAM
jgi:hypothetical protein